jgi:hypothetical protein
MTKEALNLALEALENSVDLVREDAYNAEELYGNYQARQGKVRGLKVLADDHEKAITAIKAALEAKDEPVAYINVEQRKLEWAKYMSWDTPTVVNLPKIPLYTTPPQRTWVGLTNDEVNNFAAGCHLGNSVQGAIYKAEAKLKEKNT